MLQGVRGGLTAWAGVPLPSGVSRCMQGRPPPQKKTNPQPARPASRVRVFISIQPCPSPGYPALTTSAKSTPLLLQGP